MDEWRIRGRKERKIGIAGDDRIRRLERGIENIETEDKLQTRATVIINRMNERRIRRRKKERKEKSESGDDRIRRLERGRHRKHRNGGQITNACNCPSVWFVQGGEEGSMVGSLGEGGSIDPRRCGLGRVGGGV